MLEHYLLNALRGFWRFRVTALVNLLGLALALVCFIVTYLFLDALLSGGDAQFRNASRTYVLTEELWTTPTSKMIPAFPQTSPGVARYLRADLPGLEAVARAIGLGQMAAASDDRSVDLPAAAADPELLRIFDLKPVDGDLHDALASTHSAIITESAALRLFGTVHAAGRAMLVQGRQEVAVSAVIAPPPAGSHMGDSDRAALKFDLLLPLSFYFEEGFPGVHLDPDDPQWGNDSYFTYVLLPQDGSVTLAKLKETLREFRARHIPKDAIILVHDAVPLTHLKLAMLEALAGNRGISLTAGAYLLDALILAIACLNYANLTVAIATTRAREIGIRKVLGASQPHLMRQYLVEAALLGAAALVLVLLGTAIAMPAIDRAFGLEFQLSSLLRPGLWGLVLLLLAAISLVGGAYPAFVLARVRPVESLRAGAVRAGPRFVPTVLVGVQFAAASFLLVAALLIYAQNRVLQRAGVHPERDPVVVFSNNLGMLGVSFDTLRSELLRDPRIKSVSGAPGRPWMSGGPHQNVRRTQDASSAAPVAMMNMVYYDFFSTVGLRLLAGRDFERRHADLSSFMPGAQAADSAPISGIIDRALLQQLGWQSPAQAVDQTIYLVTPWNPLDRGRPLHIIGVVENGYPRLVGPNANANIYTVTPFGVAVPLVRISREDIPGALAHIDAVWKRLAPKVPVRRQFLDELFDSAYETFATVSIVLTGLAAFAFVIAVMGLIGMAVHITSRRRREIGIRKTLGASAPGVVLMLLRDFSKPVIVANIIVWPLAFLAGKLYFDLFTHRATLTPWPFLVSLAITLAIAWLAVGAQAFRAAAVKPANVLHLD